MFFIEIVIAWIAGRTFVRALARWAATIHYLGVHRTLVGSAMMLRLRTASLYGDSGQAIPSTFPILFESTIIIFVSALYWFSFWQSGWDPTYSLYNSRAFFAFVAIWAASHASESIVPPTLLYLGVSEPGQYEMFGYLVSSRAWLVVSALDQGDLEVRGAHEVSQSLPSLLLPSVWNARFSLLFSRRRLESIRTQDDLWEPAIRRIIDYVPAIVADLRSHSTIVSQEFSWALDGLAADRLIVLTRNSGATSLDTLLNKVDVKLNEAGLTTVTADQLDNMIFELLEPRRREVRPRGSTAQGWRATAHKLMALIEEETGRKQAWKVQLKALHQPDPVLDREIWVWATGSNPYDIIPFITTTIAAATKVLLKRLDAFSYTIHFADSEDVWIDLAVHPIPGSYRVSRSDGFNAATALLLALMDAELGRGFGRPGQRQVPLRRIADLPTSDDSQIDVARLLRSAALGGGARNRVMEQELFQHFGIGNDTLFGDDLFTILDELEHAVKVVKERGRYFITVSVLMDGTGTASVEKYTGFREWSVAISHDIEHSTLYRPAIAVLIATLKAEVGLFEGIRGSWRR